MFYKLMLINNNVSSLEEILIDVFKELNIDIEYSVTSKESNILRSIIRIDNDNVNNLISILNYKISMKRISKYDLTELKEHYYFQRMYSKLLKNKFKAV